MNSLWPLRFLIIIATLLAYESLDAAPADPNRLATSFEEFAPGEMETAQDPSGKWTASPGHAATHTDHHRTGRQSLRLLGGEKRNVVWTPAPLVAEVDQLEFWLERWTNRQPFDFRVEAGDGEKWMTLFHDQGDLPVGKFKNRILIPFPDGLPQQIRFSSTTPDDSGVLIDDISVGAATPQRVVSVDARQLTVPVLVRNELNPVLDICVTVEGTENPLRINELVLKLGGTLPLDQIAQLEVFALGGLAAPNWKNLRPTSPELERIGGGANVSPTLVVASDYELSPGDNHFFVSLQLRETADPDRLLDVAATSLKITGQEHPIATSAPGGGMRIGYALRKGGDDGFHTYRIPGLVTTNQGTLIAVYDVRKRSVHDLPGDIDVGISRSVDGGRTWQPMQIVLDMGSDPKWRYDGVGDPAILVDKITGDIWVAALWSHGNQGWHGSGSGLSPEETGQLMLVRSQDDGLTWSMPMNVTKQVKRPQWSLLLQGPGKGITMQDGTLVFAAQYQDSLENRRLPRSTILYSRDHGQTWRIGAGAYDDTTEAQVIEVEPGKLMLNCRYNRKAARVVMTSTDMGRTWTEHPTSRQSLTEPRSCMASLINVNGELQVDKPGWVLFSNPDSLHSRSRQTIKASPDGGQSWPEEYHLLLDEGLGFGYSCMSMIDPQTIGIVYEGSGAQLQFQRIPLSDVIGDVPSNTAATPHDN